MIITTGSTNYTLHFDGAERVYPCRCGQTHCGDYAFEDWNHHDCFHESELILLCDEQAICGECGKSFLITRPCEGG